MNMPAAAKKTALRLMRDCGLFHVTRALSQRMPRILMYHNFAGDGNDSGAAVSVDELRSHLAYLRRHYRVVPLAQIVESAKSGAPFPDPTVALTVDDGRRNFYEVCFPLLVEFAMPATFFVVSSFIGGEDWLWTDKVLWLSEQPSAEDDLSPLNLEGLFCKLNRMSPMSRNTQIADMAGRMNVSVPARAPEKYSPCSWQELREMADSGLVDIGSHTVTHPILSSISDEESWQEFADSRAQIEESLGRNIRSFCFPNGKSGDYRPIQVQQVQDAGYRVAVTARWGFVKLGDAPYELPRIGVSGGTEPLSFFKELDGAEYYQSKWGAALGLRPG